MRKAGPISKSTTGVALVFALIAFVLGSASFTASLALAVIAVPIAVVTTFFGTWRMSLITIYWGIAALSAVPISNALPIYPDDALVLLGVGGLALSGVLCLNYVHPDPVA
jgi:hypothetical protein